MRECWPKRFVHHLKPEKIGPAPLGTVVNPKITSSHSFKLLKKDGLMLTGTGLRLLSVRCLCVLRTCAACVFIVFCVVRENFIKPLLKSNNMHGFLKKGRDEPKILESGQLHLF